MEGTPQKARRGQKQRRLSSNFRTASVVIAAITSCTNTSNPSLMLGAGLLAKKAVERGLQVKPWVKTSLAPGSKVVTDYLQAAGLTPYLEQAEFPPGGLRLHDLHRQQRPVARRHRRGDQRQQPGGGGGAKRKSQFRRAASIRWCARIIWLRRRWWWRMRSPGRMDIDMATESLGNDKNGKPVFLRDIWPTPAGNRRDGSRRRHDRHVPEANTAKCFRATSTGKACPCPRAIFTSGTEIHVHQARRRFSTTCRKNPPALTDIHGARVLAVLGDSVTTDHISPAGSITVDSPAGKYLIAQWREAARIQFVRRAARQSRSDDARHVREHPAAQPACSRNRRRLDIASAERREDDASMMLPCDTSRKRVPLIVLAGKEYGSGSSRDWAAKGTLLLGRARGHRRKLRAHPPQQSGRHGRAAAANSCRARRRESLGLTGTRELLDGRCEYVDATRAINGLGA